MFRRADSILGTVTVIHKRCVHLQNLQLGKLKRSMNQNIKWLSWKKYLTTEQTQLTVSRKASPTFWFASQLSQRDFNSARNFWCISSMSGTIKNISSTVRESIMPACSGDLSTLKYFVTIICSDSTYDCSLRKISCTTCVRVSWKQKVYHKINEWS